MLLKRIQLGLIHVAVAMTLVPINSTLNRVMIKELALSATLVAFLASLPYLFSPIQVAIGSFSDRHPLWGYRRTPYILLGLFLCVLGLLMSPQAAFLISENFWAGIVVAAFAFGAWGMGYNFASVSYLSLATDISGENGRGRTIAVMWFMMITSIILTAITISFMVDPYTPEAMNRAFWVVGGAAAVLGVLGVIRLEERVDPAGAVSRASEPSWIDMGRAILGSKQATLFFFYLLILLAAILGQDILLEPFGGEAFGMSVHETTRITSLWGVCVLVALLIAGFLEGRMSKHRVATWGAWTALTGFVMITASAFLVHSGVFFAGVVLLGIGTGLATVSNVSLMLDMTTAQNAGLFIGAWGMSNALSRLLGSLLAGGVRDVLTQILGNAVMGYAGVFVIQALFLGVSLMMLRRIDVRAFQREESSLSIIERTALANDPS